MDQPHIYQLYATDEVYRDEEKRAVVNEFIQAHGIDPNRFMIGNPIDVRRHDDGEVWMHTWQAVEGMPLRESCPACVKQERVEVPLASEVPAFADGPYVCR